MSRFPGEAQLLFGATHQSARHLVFLLESHLHLITFAAELQTTLQHSVLTFTPCFLEQIFSSLTGVSRREVWT